jgi:hypothetical protein
MVLPAVLMVQLYCWLSSIDEAKRAYRYFSESDMVVIKKIQFFLDQGFRLPVAAQKAREEILKTGGNQ